MSAAAGLREHRWIMEVQGRVYGPFDRATMHRFASEGRLAAHSVVAPEGTLDWRKAGEDALLSVCFQPKAAPQPAVQAVASPQPHDSEHGARAIRFGQAMPEAMAETSTFIVLYETKGLHAAEFERTVSAIGPAMRVLPSAWIVRTANTAAGLRNSLAPLVGARDALLVIDAARDKGAWSNFGPEIDSKLRQVWKK